MRFGKLQSLFLNAGSVPFTGTIPLSPSSITYSNVQDLQFQVNWVDNSSDEFSFEIEVYRDAGFTDLAVSTTAVPDATNKVVTGLQAGVTYYARVRARNPAGASAFANGGAQATTNTVPAAPTSLVITGITSSGMTASWTDNANNELNYAIEGSLNSGFTASIGIITLPANTTTYTITSGLPASTNIWIRVRALGTSFNSTYLAGGPFTTLDSIPATPGTVSITNVTGTEARINWFDLSNNETSFTVQVATDSGFSSLVKDETTAANAFFLDVTGLSNSTTYYARVRANNAAGSSAWSVALDPFITNSGLTIPDAPTTVTFSSIKDVSFTINWLNVPTNEDSYEIELHTNSGFSALVESKTVSADVTAVGFSNLNPYTSYWARVRATNLAGSSSWANSAEQLTKMNPTYYGADIVAWFDASTESEVTKNGSNRVSAWNNKGAGAIDALQASAALQPLYTTTGGGGVDFTSARVLIADQDVSTIVNRTVYAVVTPTAVTTQLRRIMYAGSQRLEFDYTAQTRRQAGFRSGTSGLFSIFGVNHELPVNTKFAYSFRAALVTNFATGSIWKNRDAPITVNTTPPSTLQALVSSPRIFIGSIDTAGTNSFTGIVHEIFLLKKATNTGEHDATVDYLMDKWGIT